MVHTFKCLGNDFCIDVESGSLYKVDALTRMLIEEKSSPTDSSMGDFSRFSSQEITEAQEEISQLTQEGALFSPSFEFVPKKGENIVKAMCLNICHNCNLRCEYCFADEGKYNGEKASMSIETAKAALDYLIDNSGNRMNLEVDFFGGEPLMNLDVVKQAVAYGRMLERLHNKNFRFTITTNALNLNDDVIDFFNKEMYNVVISIDGRKDVHNSVRKTAGGADSFDIVLKNALKFKEKRGGLQYYIRGTFTRLNKDFAADALSLNDCGFDQISLEPVVLTDGHRLAFTEGDLPELKEQYEVLAQEYLLRRKGDKWFNFFHFMIDLKDGPCEHKRHSSCGAGTEYIAVTPEGDIYPCHQFVGNQRFKMGSIFSGERDLNLVSYFGKNNLAYKKECANCWAKYFCSGGCAANAVNFNGSLGAPYKSACELMRKRLECALAIYAIENEL